MLAGRAIFPIQPDISRNTHHYREAVIQWNPLTENRAVYFQFEITDEGRQEFCVLPDGCVELLFRCCSENPGMYFFGKRTRMRHLSLKPGSLYFGFRPFYEAGFQLENLSYLECIDQLVELTNHHAYSGLLTKLLQAATFEERCAVFAKTGLQESFWDKVGRYAHIIECSRQICNSRGLVSVGLLGDRLGYSDRHLRRAYKNIFGITPVAYKEIIRFQNSVRLLSQSGFSDRGDYSRLSDQCGYCDQSYMIGDYRKFVDMTPKAFRASIFNG